MCLQFCSVVLKLWKLDSHCLAVKEKLGFLSKNSFHKLLDGVCVGIVFMLVWCVYVGMVFVCWDDMYMLGWYGHAGMACVFWNSVCVGMMCVFGWCVCVLG